jgi:predicted RNA-binding Zn-ribbon protein involved in translation (DUF1610 family)
MIRKVIVIFPVSLAGATLVLWLTSFEQVMSVRLVDVEQRCVGVHIFDGWAIWSDLRAGAQPADRELLQAYWEITRTDAEWVQCVWVRDVKERPLRIVLHTLGHPGRPPMIAGCLVGMPLGGFFVAFTCYSTIVLSRGPVRRWRRRKRGLCTQCGYNLTDNVSGVCPECGAVISGQDGLSGRKGGQGA